MSKFVTRAELAALYGSLNTQIAGLNSSVAQRQFLQPSLNPGVYRPVFQSSAGLSSVSGTFAIASGGGLIASTSGTTASGNINLPGIIDATKPFRYALLLQYGGSGGDGQNLLVTLANPAQAQSSVQVKFGATMSVLTGFTTLANSIAWPAGTSPQNYWFTITGDGGMGGQTPVITIALIPVAHGGLQANFTSLTNNENYAKYPYSQTFSSIPVFNGLSQIQINTKSISNVLLGVWCSTGGLTGASDSRMQPPAILCTTISGDSGVVVRIPETYTGVSTTDMIVSSHGNNSAALLGQDSQAADGGVAFATLAANGYIIAASQNSNDYSQTVTCGAAGATNGATSVPVVALVSPIPVGTVLTWNNGSSAATTLTATAYIGATSLAVSGTWGGSGNLSSGNTATYSTSTLFSGPLSSNWGAPGPLLTFELQMVSTLRAQLPGIRNLYKIGQSMGLLNSLAELSLQPGLYKAVYGIDGVTNVTDAYNNSGFSSIINAAWTTYYVCIQANTGQAVTATAFWTPITVIGGYPPTTYQTSPYSVRGAYSGSTAYSVNDVVYSNATALSQVVDHDPQLQPGLYTGVPIRCVIASGDTTISPTNQAALFATTVNALGGSITTLTVSGNHLAAPSYSGPDMLSFFQAHP